jgi:leader peptidase (prepilin peptidase)/N-methyltransferase
MRAIAIGVLIGWCVLLAGIDLRLRRLPNALTVPGALAVLGYASATGTGTRAICGGCGLAATYLVIHLLAPAAFGAGDVKFALGLGAAAGIGGLAAWTLAAVTAPILTAATGAAWWALRRRRCPPLPHGPAMTVATLAALLACG